MRNFDRKEITTNWRSVAAYFLLFGVLLIAGILVITSSKSIEKKYGEFASTATQKLVLLFNTGANNEFIQAKSIDQVFHPISLGSVQETALEQKIVSNENNLNSYGNLLESENEKQSYSLLQQSWDAYMLSREHFFSLKENEDSAITYYRSVHKKAYDKLQASLSALSVTLSSTINAEDKAINNFVVVSHIRINSLIGAGIVLLCILGVLVFRGAKNLYAQNKLLHGLQHQLLEKEIEKQKEISRATLTAQELERHELGKELHDNVNQILSTSKLYLDSSFYNTNGQREQLIVRSRDLINMAIEALRKLSRSLAPPSLGDLTLQESVEDLVSDYNLAHDARIELTLHGLEEEKMSDGLKTSVYRIMQEQLTNIRKYADASLIRMGLEQTRDHLTLKIQDDGRGFDIKTKRKGMGITNIINRAQIYNGIVLLDSAPSKGCTLQIRFALPPIIVLA
jgi:signal transduction histidine kinase